MSVTVSKYVDVEVDIDAEDIAELSDKELREIGLCRGVTQAEALEAAKPLDVQWRAVRKALIDGDQRDLVQQLNSMAWAQAGVMIPVIPATRGVLSGTVRACARRQ